MRRRTAVNVAKRLKDSRADFQTALEYGIRELDITLIRPTNYTDDGYPIKTRIGVIRSNTLTQIGTLVRDLATTTARSGVSASRLVLCECLGRAHCHHTCLPSSPD